MILLQGMAVNDEFDVRSLTKERLPQYIVNCFLAAGFDVPDVITSMDISEQPGNSIELIEKFIDQHYSGHEDYCSVPTSHMQRPFVFPLC